ncbi:hypothetical protein BHM03_00014883 [Ensete ventricosum]|nr:hypothetical protein BHM03_00014883 [Ensete ventricosum]
MAYGLGITKVSKSTAGYGVQPELMRFSVLVDPVRDHTDGLSLSVGDFSYRITLCAEDHVPSLAGRIVAGDLGVQEACPGVGILGLELVGDNALVVLLRDLRYLGRSVGETDGVLLRAEDLEEGRETAAVTAAVAMEEFWGGEEGKLGEEGLAKRAKQVGEDSEIGMIGGHW